jgi:hypothetical protein
MVDRPSEIRSGLPCPNCGRSLLPVPLESTVIFHCRNGHEVPLADLVRTQSLVLRMGLETLMLQWMRQLAGLNNTIDDARLNGYLDVAEIIQRHAQSLKGRLQQLQNAFTQSEVERASQDYSRLEEASRGSTIPGSAVSPAASRNARV